LRKQWVLRAAILRFLGANVCFHKPTLVPFGGRRQRAAAVKLGIVTPHHLFVLHEREKQEPLSARCKRVGNESHFGEKAGASNQAASKTTALMLSRGDVWSPALQPSRGLNAFQLSF
jgi:hypothetical protein